MPHSAPWLKDDLFREIAKRFDRATSIVDVGAGDGKTGEKLKEMGSSNVTAIEVWAPYVERFGLKDIYDEVLVGNAMDFCFKDWELAILGDVLEHLTVFEAQSLLQQLALDKCACLVVVPWKLPQGAWEGNPYEEHKQPDLTPGLMLKRYPSLKLLKSHAAKGLYFRP